MLGGGRVEGLGGWGGGVFSERQSFSRSWEVLCRQPFDLPVQISMSRVDAKRHQKYILPSVGFPGHAVV